MAAAIPTWANMVLLTIPVLAMAAIMEVVVVMALPAATAIIIHLMAPARWGARITAARAAITVLLLTEVAAANMTTSIKHNCSFI